MKWSSSRRGSAGQGDTFISSQDLQSATLFGDYRVMARDERGVTTNICRAPDRISQALSEPRPRATKKSPRTRPSPICRSIQPSLTGWLDDYIWTVLFGTTFNLLRAKTRRACLLPASGGGPHQRCLPRPCWNSSKSTHRLRLKCTPFRARCRKPPCCARATGEVSKCIYTPLGWPARNGGLGARSSALGAG